MLKFPRPLRVVDSNIEAEYQIRTMQAVLTGPGLANENSDSMIVAGQASHYGCTLGTPNTHLVAAG